MERAFDVIVIGAGAAGLSAATSLARRGQQVALVERSQYLGGECPNYACVPTKALLHAAKTYAHVHAATKYGIELAGLSFRYHDVKTYKDRVVAETGGRNLTAEDLAQRGITLFRGTAKFSNTHSLNVDGQRLSGRQFVVATGTSTFIPPIEGLKNTPYLTSREAIDLTECPESLIILGGGPVGVEFATIFSHFGSDVTLLEHNNTILHREEPETRSVIAGALKNAGVHIVTNFTAEQIRGDDEGIEVVGRSEQLKTYQAANLLVATGTSPNVHTLNLAVTGAQVNRRGVQTDDHLRSSAAHIWACGDVSGHFLYTHTAHYEGLLVADNILGAQRTLDLRVVPRGVFSSPELASVGESSMALEKRKRPFVVGLARVEDLSRSLTDDSGQGVVKILADPHHGTVLGGSVASPRAGEMIHELALAMRLGGSVNDLAEMLHAFPTYSEAVLVAASDAQSKLRSSSSAQAPQRR